MLAPFWADINPGSSLDGVDEDGAVFHQIFSSSFVIQWNQVTYWTPDNNPTANTFEIVGFASGAVAFNYMTMDPAHLSWSAESIGYEDGSGTLGVQISYGEIPVSGTTYWIPPICSSAMSPGPVGGSAPVEGADAAACPTDYSSASQWVDISGTGTEILDDQWANPLNTWNHDDGFVDVALPFAFSWFQMPQSTITIGTNGMASFGTAHLRNGGSEPIPCVNLCGNNDANYGSHTSHADWGIDGVLAPFWADINPGSSLDGVQESGAVYFQIFADSAVVQWNLCTYWTPDNNPTAQTFEAIIFSDGGVVFSYLDMDDTKTHLSWSDESIGYEDQTGSMGAQIAYSSDGSAIPDDLTTYYIAPDCSSMAATVSPTSVVTMASSTAGSTTVRLMVNLDATQSNVYTIAGNSATALSMPPAAQVAAPFGTDVGGVSPAFFAVMADSEFDSWLTVGMTDASNPTAISTIGLDFSTWTSTSSLTSNNGAVFWMTPQNGPSGSGIVLAQVTSTTATGSASGLLQGKSTVVTDDDWTMAAAWSW